MISSINLNSDETVETLRQCIEKVQNCGVVTTLRQGMEAADGTGREIVINTQTVETAENEIYVNMEDGYVYLHIHEVDGNFFELKKMRLLWDAMVKHNSEQNIKGQPADYFLTVDLIKAELENSRSYCVSILNPIFAAEDEGEIVFVGLAFEDNRFEFGIENVSLVDIEYEEELYNETISDRTEDMYEDDDDTLYYEDEVSDDMLSNDEFTDFMSN